MPLITTTARTIPIDPTYSTRLATMATTASASYPVWLTIGIRFSHQVQILVTSCTLLSSSPRPETSSTILEFFPISLSPRSGYPAANPLLSYQRTQASNPISLQDGPLLAYQRKGAPSPIRPPEGPLLVRPVHRRFLRWYVLPLKHLVD